LTDLTHERESNREENVGRRREPRVAASRLRSISRSAISWCVAANTKMVRLSGRCPAASD
jgi:hypothetical protein